MAFQSLKAVDIFCYICRGILIEPVTVPCNHVFCLKCFEESIAETSYSCPLCRRRISNWVRSAKKQDKLLNTELWEKIKVEFKDLVALKLSGVDDFLDEHIREQFAHQPISCSSGEVGQEYFKLLKDHEEGIKRQRNDEEKKSLQLIDELEKNGEVQKEIFHLQHTIASSTSTTNTLVASTSKTTSISASKQTSISKKVVVGPMDRHIKRLGLVEGSSKQTRMWGSHLIDSRCDSSDSGDSIGSELHHFKPIRIMPKTPPKDGTRHEHILQKIPPLKLFLDNPICSSMKITDQYSSIHSNFSAFRGRTDCNSDETSETPKKKAKLKGNDVFETGVLKEINLDENSDSNSIEKSEAESKSQEDVRIPKLSSSLLGEENLLGIDELFDVEEQKRLEERILQEKADEELALKLSREWEQNTARLPQTCCSSARQTTLLDAVGRRRKK